MDKNYSQKIRDNAEQSSFLSSPRSPLTLPTIPSSYVNHKGTIQTIEELCQHYDSPPQSRPTSPTKHQTLLPDKTTPKESMRLFEEALDEVAHQGQGDSHNPPEYTMDDLFTTRDH
jgi:hypothetical protein